MPRSVVPQFSLPYVDERPVRLATRHPAMLRLYQRAKDRLWLPQDYDHEIDAADWAVALSEKEKHLLSRILGFMTTAYHAMTDGVLRRFAEDLNVLEATFFYDLQTAVINLHTESVARALQVIVRDQRQRQDILNSAIMLHNFADQTNWCTRWLQDQALSLPQRAVAFIFAKTIFFRSGYVVAEWFKLRGRMPGIAALFDLLTGDNDLQTESACLILTGEENLPDIAEVHALVQQAVEIEGSFIRDAFNFLSLPSLNVSDLIEFIKFTADTTLRTLGYDICFGAHNRLSFATVATLPGQANIDAVNREEIREQLAFLREVHADAILLTSPRPSERRSQSTEAVVLTDAELSAQVDAGGTRNAPMSDGEGVVGNGGGV